MKSNKEGHTKFIEAIILYFVYRDLSFSKTYFEKDNNMNLAGILWDNAELFVVAHEYSHIILDHLSIEKEITKRYLFDYSMLYEVVRNWNEEFSADKLALQTTLAYNNNKAGYGSFCCFLGIEFLFSCLSLIEEATNCGCSETHPSAEMRINKLRQNLSSIIPDDAETIISGTCIIRDIVSDLWNTNKEMIYDIYNKILK
ncbi:hypothetical protein [Ruminiclostridium cellobioparum]|uniref:hypothetical protein n=1 Tax=Ruminiclostridium cellobioparum TaxID=29355 RepID=UPI0028AAE744|nr:hypothetical protein [Ruminiclostridium cellobioparum]